MKWGAFAIALKIPFNPPDHDLPEVLEHLQRPDFTLEVCAEWLRTDLQSLCAFLTSDRGLALLAHTELAQAIHIRAIAIAQLPHVINAMTYALDDFAETCRNVPLNPKSMQALEFVERAKENARKNGTLLLRLAHFAPRPLRSYTLPPHAPSTSGASAAATAHHTPNPKALVEIAAPSPSQREGAGGWVPDASNHTTPLETAAPSPSQMGARAGGWVPDASNDTTPLEIASPSPSQREGAGGWVPDASNHITALEIASPCPSQMGARAGGWVHPAPNHTTPLEVAPPSQMGASAEGSVHPASNQSPTIQPAALTSPEPERVATTRTQPQAVERTPAHRSTDAAQRRSSSPSALPLTAFPSSRSPPACRTG